VKSPTFDPSTLLRSTLLLGAALLATGCSRPTEPAASTPAQAQAPVETLPEGSAHLPPGIDWFQGDVDAAFAAARETNKPLFLYWGAEWCPPCAQIKATIFSRREFQERSRLFIPVYLDGDTPGAQRHGERFGVIGYPTMILFRPDGTEITRLPGGVDVARYAKILDVAVADARPVAELVTAVREGQDVSPDDWRLLAYYPWYADNGRVVPAAERTRTFRLLADRCPPGLEPECGRLLFAFLGAAATGASDGAQPFTGLDRAEQRTRLLKLLASPSVADANVDNLLFASRDAVALLSDPGTPERTQLTASWRAALDRLGSGAPGHALSAPEQLNLVRARVLLARLDAPDAPLPPALLDTARETVARLDAATTDAYARQALVNAAVGLYWEAGLDSDADRLLVAELDKSKSPYYFMLDLADLAQKAGRSEDAVAWLARAYEGAEGPATRFQWGYNYMLGLLEMVPDDTARIEHVGLEVLGELDGVPDAFYQRTRLRLDQLSSKLLEWGVSPDRKAVIATLKARTTRICEGLPANDPGRGTCEHFLSGGPPATPAA
jgi:thiol-disulfide isomerase/thioredoxin